MSNPTPPTEAIILLVSPDETTPTEGQRGWGEALQKQAAALVEVKIDPQVLERQMTGFLSVVGRLFQQADQQIQSQPGTPPGGATFRSRIVGRDQCQRGSEAGRWG